MGFLIYLFPGAIALGGVLIYHVFKDRTIVVLIKTIAISFYILGGVIALPQISDQWQSLMSGNFDVNVTFAPFIAVTAYILIATVLLRVSVKLQNKQSSASADKRRKKED